MTLLPSIHPGAGEHALMTRLHGLIDRFGACEIAVVGDLVADEFIYGRLSRVSREAPVLILKYDRTTIVPGGAGNAAANTAALGGQVRLVARVGRQDVDRRLVRALPRRVARTGLLRPPGYHVPVKTRILAGGLHTARQQVVRIDRAPATAPDEKGRREIERVARRAIKGCDGLLVSDYGGGLVTPALVTVLRGALTRQRRRQTAPLLVDSRYDLLRYRSMTACTPNESEVEQLLGTSIGDDPRRLERAGRALLKRTRSQGLVITRGSRGMAVFSPGARTAHLPIYGTDEVADVTGAGDTVIATMTLAVAAGGSLYEAARLATYAGGIVVMKRGTATVSATELHDAVTADLGERG